MCAVNMLKYNFEKSRDKKYLSYVQIRAYNSEICNSFPDIQLHKKNN